MRQPFLEPKTLGKIDGLLKAIVDTDTGRILGCSLWEQREKVRSGFGSQLHPYILNKTWFFSCDRILKQAIYVPGFSTSQNRIAPVPCCVMKQVK
ncbi:hypothetical protein [Nostoc sp.]|uniref:hypothetical protein n=1 Tax=Nostoc sp. TaxID=1180 RepID=UPI002FFA6EB3